MLLVGLVLWQVHLTLTVANDAENAARTASRSGGGADAGAPGARAAVPRQRHQVQAGASSECGIQVTGTRVQVWVDVPVIVPGGSNLGLGFKVHGEADAAGGRVLTWA